MRLGLAAMLEPECEVVECCGGKGGCPEPEPLFGVEDEAVVVVVVEREAEVVVAVVVVVAEEVVFVVW